MADLSQTPANVRAGTGAVTELVQAGEAFSAGSPLYFKSSDGYYYKADADDADKYDVAGVALTGADAAGDRFVIQTDGQWDCGANTTQGEIYIVSDTAGAIAPCGDLAATWYPAIVGVALNATGLIDLILQSGSAAHS